MSITLDRRPGPSPNRGSQQKMRPNAYSGTAATNCRRNGSVARCALFWRPVREPMLQLLLAAGVIYLVIGDLAEALILLAFAVLNVGLVVVQESRTERALAALNDMTSPRALVVRDGTHQRIPGAEIVVGESCCRRRR